MRPYSMDLRERVAAAVDDHVLSLRQIAGLFRVSLSFVSRLLKRRRDTGALEAAARRLAGSRTFACDVRDAAAVIGCSDSQVYNYLAGGDLTATNVAGDANGQSDVFVRVRGSGSTELISVASAGATAPMR